MGINNVIICGLGALGLTYANKLKDICNLKILADEKRIKKYLKNSPKFNGENLLFDYILPTDYFKADLIIISTKSSGLDSAIEYIKNFVHKNTIIISLINGISSEEKIQKIYKNNLVLKSYFIGHSAIKKDNNVTQDGYGKIVIEQNKDLEFFFKQNNINYEVSNNIEYSQWVKLGVNIVLNQLTAIHETNVGELKKHKDYMFYAKNLINETKNIAYLHGIKNIENYEQDVFDSINLIADDGKTSMYQDIIAKKKTEIELFSGEIIKLGKIYNIKTPFNQDIYDKIKLKEESFSWT